MKTTGWVIAMLLSLGIGSASAEGLNLSWDDCGAAGTSFKQFACNTNEGQDRLVMSVEAPAGIDTICGVIAALHINANMGGIPPDWWRAETPFGQLGNCRDSTAIRPELASTSCPRVLVPDLVTWAYQIVPPLIPPHLLMFHLTIGSPTSRGTVEPGIEYDIATWVINHSRTIGPDACAGCESEGCIVLNSVSFVPACGVSVVTVTNPLERNFVTWQSDAILGCPMSTPTRRATWGQVRSLYR